MSQAFSRYRGGHIRVSQPSAHPLERRSKYNSVSTVVSGNLESVVPRGPSGTQKLVEDKLTSRRGSVIETALSENAAGAPGYKAVDFSFEYVTIAGGVVVSLMVLVFIWGLVT